MSLEVSPDSEEKPKGPRFPFSSRVAVIGAGTASVAADLALMRAIGDPLGYEVWPEYDADLYVGLAGLLLYLFMCGEKGARKAGARVFNWISPLLILRILRLKNGKPHHKKPDEENSDH